MSFKIKKTYSKTQDMLEVIEEEKENIYSKLRKRTKHSQQVTKEKQADSDEEFEKLLSSPQKLEDNRKPLTFWSKKLKELETPKDLKGKKKCGLYEFNETTEESLSPYERKKKVRQKRGIKKNNEGREKQRTNKIKAPKQVKFKTKPSKGFVESKQKIMSKKDNCKLSKNENEKSALLPRWPSNLTSTPAKKGNSFATLDFTFLSPVRKEDAQQFTLHENSYIAHDDEEQVKCLERKFKSPKTPKTVKILPGPNKRVLRSKKIITQT